MEIEYKELCVAYDDKVKLMYYPTSLIEVVILDIAHNEVEVVFGMIDGNNINVRHMNGKHIRDGTKIQVKYGRWIDIYKDEDEDMRQKFYTSTNAEPYELLRYILNIKHNTGRLPKIIGNEHDVKFYSDMINRLDGHKENRKPVVKIGDKYHISILKEIDARTDGSEIETIYKNCIGTITHHFKESRLFTLNINGNKAIIVDETYLNGLNKCE